MPKVPLLYTFLKPINAVIISEKGIEDIIFLNYLLKLIWEDGM